MLALAAFSSASLASKVEIKYATIEEAKPLIAKGYVLVNAMPNAKPTFFDDCTIEGSINMSILDKAEFEKQAKEKLEGNPGVIVFCAFQECPISTMAYSHLQMMEAKEGRSLFGDLVKLKPGVKEWRAAGGPTEGKCRLAYIKPKDAPARAFEMPKAESAAAAPVEKKEEVQQGFFARIRSSIGL